MDITTFALAKKYTDTHASKLTKEDAIQAVANYFDENPNAIVTNDELETVLNEYFKKDALSDLETIRAGAALGATSLQSLPEGNVVDAQYVHTDNNYDDFAKSKVDAIPVDPKYTDTIYNDTILKQDIAETKIIAERAEVVAKRRATAYIYDTVEDLDTALTDEEFVARLVIGDNFYIRALDVPDYWWDGTTKQQLETEKPDLTGLVKDVQVNDSSIATDGIANIPIGSATVLGVFKVNSGAGIDVGSSGDLRVKAAPKSLIAVRSNLSQPIVPSTLDYAVKAAMCDDKGEAWTDAEKAGAWKRQTILKTAMDEIAVAGAQYYLGEQTAVNIVLPGDAQIGQMITVSWYNGATPANLSITGTMLAFEYIPSANTRSEINALWDGLYWAVIGNEIEVPN